VHQRARHRLWSGDFEKSCEYPAGRASLLLKPKKDKDIELILKGENMVKSRITRNALLAGTVVLLAGGGVWAAQSAKPGAELLGSIPAKSLFCVRINNLDGALRAVNEYLKGVAPESFDAQAAVISKLGKALGDEKLSGVNRGGNFAVFAVNVPSQSPGGVAGQPGAGGPMANLFIGAMLLVTDYEQFISQNPNCGKPDGEGISTITVDGRPSSLVTSFQRFALVCPPNLREKLIPVKKMLAQGESSLVTVLDGEQQKLAGSESVWAYVNVKEASGLIGPMFFAQLGQMKTQLQKMKESGQGPAMMVDPAGIMDFYGGMFRMVMDGTDYMTIALSPAPQTCSLTVGVKAVPGSDMAAIVGSPMSGDFGNMLGYLDDGAMMNLGCKVDRESLKVAYTKLIDLVGKMAAEAMPAEDLDKIKALTAKFIDAMGDSLAISAGTTGPEAPLVSIKYVLKVKDEASFKEVIDEQLKMMQEGAFAKLYKGFGMEMDFKVQRQTDTYKGIRIDSAKLTFKMGDEKSPQTQMIRKIYGDALDYRWAFVKGHCVYAIGGGADAGVRELIDQVQAGGPSQMGSQMKAALAAIPQSQQADAVGTFNYVRLLNMVLGAMHTPGGESTVKLDVPTTSNIAFAARTTSDGVLKMQMVLPKEHLVEIQSAFKTLSAFKTPIPQIKKQEGL
jgi:hypothetical protein